MKIKIRYENEYQTLEVENVELERWLNISISEDESQEDYEKRIQDVIEERFNRLDYNSWHKHDRHTGNAYMSGLAVCKMFSIKDKKRPIVTMVVGAIGIIFAIMGLADVLNTYISIIGAVVPPIMGIIIADYWVICKGRKENWAPNVALGICTWCGYDGHELLKEEGV